ncbi:MAG: excinuclease ABC subunit UvrA [Bacteroidota bacterium]
MDHGSIRVKNARQNNLKGFDLELPLNELIVVTGVSGSGKSSLAFDTIYAEGQRRYVETFSPYARQFLERMDKPAADAIEGIPPAIAIDQVNPVRTSRSTVGTMTELNDHLKLLFARAARLYCRGCGREVRRDTPDSILAELMTRASGEIPALITFTVTVPKNFTEKEILGLLANQGYTRIHRKYGEQIEVIQDRVRLAPDNRARIIEDLEAALKIGRGRVTVHVGAAAGPSPSSPSLLPQGGEGSLTPTPLPHAGEGRSVRSEPSARRATSFTWRFSSELHCADCDIAYREPVPNFFSFNSPIGACDTCRGFGRTIGVDYALVVPDESKTLAQGAVRPWQTQSYIECQGDLMRFARKRGVPTDVPWRELAEKHKRWVLDGEGEWNDKVWYGVARFFKWLETKAYRMHIRVLLSKYRAYTPCPACHGARLKPEALLCRLGTQSDAEHVLAPANRFRPAETTLSDTQWTGLPGLNIHDVMCLPIERVSDFFRNLNLPAPLDQAADLLLGEIRSRLRYLVEVGLGYLTLDRQSRTLSGGEVQRINLTTALGTSLVNTLFVLDEPSIGLHARDMNRVIGVLQRLRDAGNSLLVVEHDPQVMAAADRILDLGPGPGERGGAIVAFGTPAEIMKSRRSLTGQYLSGKKSVVTEITARPLADKFLGLLGAAENNLKGVDVKIPLNRLVCVTGVSGSGKSTLVQDVLYNALMKLKGKPKEMPGRHRALRGHEKIRDVVLVDQSPIGRTARSNPASYVGALDGIRKLYAEEPLARERGYSASTFSFNAGTGRCPTCTGSGFEHVEMQFLSDVYLRCPDCDGKRFRPEVREVKLMPAGQTQPKSISDVLDMTISEAMAFFSAYPEIGRALEPLAAVGLSYMKLGQPVPTLSGGEAQRLKLAGHLAQARDVRPSPRRRGSPDAAANQNEGNRGGILFLFDEPTTGLHFDDIATLLGAFRRLLDEGHSLMVIEHNLDVIRAADWIIDLGPEGGDAGGTIVCAGTPNEVAQHPTSHTGKALREYNLEIASRPLALIPSPARGQGGEPSALRATPFDRAIHIHHAREHNLKNIEVAIPRDRFTVITGVSGSGKSTLAFDILFAEGQRRYLESLNAYARQFVQPAARPDVDAIFGIPPTVAIEQRTSRGGRKSTVATMTEIYHFLRLLFVKLGTQYCPDCDIPIEAQTPEAILARLLRDYRGKKIQVLAPLVTARKGYYTDLAKWALAKGFDYLRVDGKSAATSQWPRLARFKEHNIELPVGAITVSAKTEAELRALLIRALDLGKDVVKIVTAFDPLTPALSQGEREKRAKRREMDPRSRQGEGQGEGVVFSTKRACPGCGRGFSELDPRLFSYNSKHGWCERCYGTGLLMSGFDEQQTGEEIWWNAWWEGGERTCPACAGKRLNPTALAVRFEDRNIAEFAALPVEAAEKLFTRLRLRGRAAEIARDILPELRTRLQFLRQVGLNYLTLDRSAPTLSGGEAQRIRLASQLGSNLRGVCYILDEPTIGLHHRDNLKLLDTLESLERKGNTVVVVEHDEETIRRAQHVIDLGPGAGKNGGRIVAEGTVRDLMRQRESATGRCLAQPLVHPLMPRRGFAPGDPALEIVGASMHNLQNLDITIPLGRLVCVTGVSGSGKSTLTRHVLHDNLKRLRTVKRPGPLAGCREIRGTESLQRVLEVDQTPIGKTPRSCPATYVGFWDNIRRLYAETTEARLRGYGPSRFSFNVSGGRCEACEGQGVKTIEMSFLPDVTVACEECHGARFNGETLMVRYKDKTIAEVLAMNVDEAVGFFAAHERIHHALRLMQDVGLGYITLGQPSPTLSGGEAQRIKLVTELAKARPAETMQTAQARSKGRLFTRTQTLYVLDEPTIGLHMADVEKLTRVLHRLVGAGNSVVVIEHNLDVIADADWIIDLGPEGGDGGGRIVAQGAPETVARRRHGSHTARALAEFLATHGSKRTTDVTPMPA